MCSLVSVLFLGTADGGFTGNDNNNDNDPCLAHDYFINFSLNMDHIHVMSHVRHTEQSSQNKQSKDINYNTVAGVL